jgi:cell division protein FtsQ
MKDEQKILKRKKYLLITIRLLLWIAIIVYLVIAFGFIADKSDSLICNAIKVIVADSSDNAFIQKSEILTRLHNSNIRIIGNQIDLINTYEIENLFKNHPSLRNAQVYKTINGNICIYVEQKNPLIRVFASTGQTFYIDDKGGFIPFSNRYTSYVIVANGNIPVNLNFSEDISVYNWHGIKSSNNNILKDIYEISKYLNSNDFWKSQIGQIHVLKPNEYELVPRVGAHIINIGNTLNLEEKLRNLKAVYEKGFNHYGWNVYKYINLKYKNQVICTKRENYE